MAKPPATPPSSDIDGVDEDRQPIDQPGNSTPKQTRKAQQEQEEAHGRPKPSRP